MEIVKAFQDNLDVTIKGTYEKPLFRTSDIANILEIANSRSMIKDFDITEKAVVSIDTPGGRQEVSFLTEKGLYQVLFTSRKPIAKKFKNWVCEVIEEIRLNGKYELEKQIVNITEQKEKTLLKNFSKKPILYVGYTEDNIVKFGYTDDIETRIKDHKKEIKSDWTPIFVYESLHNREIERRIKQCKTIKIVTKIYNSKKQTELIQLNDVFNINDLDKIILGIKNDLESTRNDRDEINKLKAENAKLKLQLENKIESKSFIIDLQLNSMENLNLKLHEIKRAVCYNFLVDMIAKEIVKNDGNTNIEIKLNIDEIFEKYKQFRESNKYQDPIYNEQYEKTWITKTFNDIDGIKNTYKTINGVQSRAKLFYIDKISEWICEHIQIPKRFRSIFREVMKDVVFVNDYCEILNKDIDFIYSTTYSFLIHLILKFRNDNTDFIIKNTILTEEYLKFMIQFEEKRLSSVKLKDILTEIPGIKNISYSNGQNIKGMIINVNNVLDWIDDTLEIPEQFSKRLRNERNS